jgi:glycosyltransferase involved in cell wall biosynthesis
MHITITVVTYNGARTIGRTLNALCNLILPENMDFDVLVVDNCSTDDTPDIVESFRGKLPLGCILENQQGVSHARNRAVAAATGDLIFCIDDDIIVDDTWMLAYSSAITEYPDASFYGGPVLPLFDQPPPGWIERNLDHLIGPYSLLPDDQSGPRLMAEGEGPYIGNVAFRKGAIQHYAFSPRLGHVGDALLGGEDAALFSRMIQDGHVGVWTDGTAKHIISRDMLRLAYVRSWYYAYGVRASVIGHDDSPNGNVGALKPPWRRALEHDSAYFIFGGPPWLKFVKVRAYILGANSMLSRGRRRGGDEAQSDA